MNKTKLCFLLVVLVFSTTIPSMLAQANLTMQQNRSCLPHGKEIVHIGLEEDGSYVCARTLHGRVLGRTYFAAS